MPWAETRWVAGVGSGATAFLSVAGCFRLFLIDCADVAPRLAQEWGLILGLVGLIVAFASGWLAFTVVHRSTSALSLMRRIGWVLLCLGVAMIFGGGILFFMPHQQPVHPGRMPAGDVAGGLLVLLIAYAGAVVLFVGLLFVLGSGIWGWIARRKAKRG